MKVSELISLLEKFNPDAEIVSSSSGRWSRFDIDEKQMKIDTTIGRQILEDLGHENIKDGKGFVVI